MSVGALHIAASTLFKVNSYLVTRTVAKVFKEQKRGKDVDIVNGKATLYHFSTGNVVPPHLNGWRRPTLAIWLARLRGAS